MARTDPDAAVAACFQRLRRAEPLLAEWARHRDVADAMYQTREPPWSLVDPAVENRGKTEAALAAVYGVANFREAQARHEDDRRLLRDVLSETARLMGHLTVERMRAAGPAITGSILGDPTRFETETSSDGPLDRFSRALAAWLVHTSDLPFPAFAEDPPQWRDPRLGPPPMPTPAGGLPGGTPGPPASGAPLDTSQLGTFQWKDFDSYANPGVAWAHADLGTDDPKQVRLRLLAPEAGGFPILVVVRRLRDDPLRVYEMLRLDQGERRTQVAALVGEIDRFLNESLDATVRALTGDSGPDWRTLSPLLEAARATWLDPTADKDLWWAAGEEIERLKPRSLNDYVSAGLMVLSLALLLAGPLGLVARFGIAAVTAAGAVVEAADLTFSLATLAARRGEAQVINRYAEIDKALEVAESVERLDADMALTVVMFLLPDAVAKAAPAVTKAVRHSARNAGAAFTGLSEFRLQVPPWMDEAAQARRAPAPAPTSTGAVDPPPARTPDAPPRTAAADPPQSRTAEAPPQRESATARPASSPMPDRVTVPDAPPPPPAPPPVSLAPPAAGRPPRGVTQPVESAPPGPATPTRADTTVPGSASDAPQAGAGQDAAPAGMPETAPARPASDRPARSPELQDLVDRVPLLRSLDDVAIRRVLAKGPNADHMRGQLLEELIEAEVLPQLRVRSGGLGVRAGNDLEFIPGHMIRDSKGAQITDGILAYRSDGELVVVAVFEAKAGKAAARELAIGRESLSRMAEAARQERTAYARDLWRKDQRAALAEGKPFGRTVADYEKTLPLWEPGQFRRDVERGYDGEWRVGSETLPVRLSPNNTKFFGVVPDDVNTSAVTERLEDSGLLTEMVPVGATQAQLRDAVDRMLVSEPGVAR